MMPHGLLHHRVGVGGGQGDWAALGLRSEREATEFAASQSGSD